MRTDKLWGWIGIAGLFASGFLYIGTYLVVPLWAAVLLCLVWVLLLRLGFRWLDTHPYWVMALPIVSGVVCLGSVEIGAELFGWPA